MNKKIRKVLNPFAFVFVAFTLISCRTTISVTSKERFDNSIKNTEVQLKQIGFQKTGQNSNKNTEISSSTGFMYMQNVGVLPYSSVTKNETTIDNYVYVDSTGSTLSFNVAYELKESSDNYLYVENVNVVGCTTSKPDNYEKLCGDESIIRKLNSIEKNDKVSVDDDGKTIGLILGLEGGLLVALCIILAMSI